MTFDANNWPTITIQGSGFGSTFHPYNWVWWSRHRVSVTDTTGGWKMSSYNWWDPVQAQILSWTDNQITVSPYWFGAYGWWYTFNQGDQYTVNVSIRGTKVSYSSSVPRQHHHRDFDWYW